MAETRIPLSVKDCTLTIADYSGTPKTYVPVIMSGTITWSTHHPEAVETTDQNGAALGIRDGAQSGRSEVTLSDVVIWDVGEHATDVTIMDIVTQTGVVASSWTTASGTGADGSRVIPSVEATERKRFKLTIVVANRGASGTVKGGTYTWDDVDVVPGATPSYENGMCRFPSLVFRSSQMAPNHTRTT